MWTDRTLGDHIGTLPGFAFSSDYFNNSADGLPLIRIRDIDSKLTEVHYSGTYPPAFVVAEGDILVGMDGEFNLRLWQGEKALLNQRVLKVFAKPSGEIDLGFAYYWLGPFLKKVEAATAATTVKHLSAKDVERAVIRSPDKDTQETIARILRALDTQIEATEALIAKQERVRAGLMQDLFTRGVDEHGQLRPPRDQAPHLYHQTELGWLPLRWAVRSVDDATESVIDGPFGSNLKSEHYVDEPGVRVIRLQNIQTGIYDNRDSVYVSDRHAQFLARFSVLPGDVLIASLGDDRYQAGRACCYPSGLGPAINKADCFRVRADKIEAISKFLMLTFNSDRMRLESVKLIQGVTRQRINVGNFKKLLIALPGWRSKGHLRLPMKCRLLRLID